MMGLRVEKDVLFACLASAALFLATGATIHAAPADTSADAGDALGEVIVTARRREETNLKVPIAITALTDQMLRAENVLSIDDIAEVTPGLTRDSTTTGSACSDRSFESLGKLCTGVIK
jgi:iron complex outermembrane receptor protein